MSKVKRGFTLIELLVVIAIIAILAAILFPVFAQAKLAAKKAASISNSKQIILAALMYSADYDDLSPKTLFLPAGYSWPQPIGWRRPHNMQIGLNAYIKTGRGCGDLGEPNPGSLWWDGADPMGGSRFLWGSYITNGTMTGIGMSFSSVGEPSNTIFTGLRAKNWAVVVDVSPPANPGPADKFWDTEYYNMATMPWYDGSASEESVSSPYTYGSGRVAPPCTLVPTDPYCVNWDTRIDPARYSNQSIYSFADGHAASKNFAATVKSGSDNLWDAF
ncbi:MAG: prepilin-type N-terminal cleavage/methylation domain-containing protein [Fimbriimonadaceae bacterium]|nr:prepilin-type N-terminal cleavage/methylation domain-containing protein [Fimbriimonadaceae bacterium]